MLHDCAHSKGNSSCFAQSYCLMRKHCSCSSTIAAKRNMHRVVAQQHLVRFCSGLQPAIELCKATGHPISELLRCTSRNCQLSHVKTGTASCSSSRNQQCSGTRRVSLAHNAFYAQYSQMPHATLGTRRTILAAYIHRQHNPGTDYFTAPSADTHGNLCAN